MVDVDDLRHAGPRMRIVAIGAGHAVVLVDRGVPGHRRRAGVATAGRGPSGWISLIWPCGSWQVVQLKPLGPQIWCGPAICWNSCMSPWQR